MMRLACDLKALPALAAAQHPCSEQGSIIRVVTREFAQFPSIFIIRVIRYMLLGCFAGIILLEIAFLEWFKRSFF